MQAMALSEGTGSARKRPAMRHGMSPPAAPLWEPAGAVHCPRRVGVASMLGCRAEAWDGACRVRGSEIP